MRPETATNEEVPARSGPEILGVGQDWHEGFKRAMRLRAARWAEGNEGPGITQRYVLRPRL